MGGNRLHSASRNLKICQDSWAAVGPFMSTWTSEGMTSGGGGGGGEFTQLNEIQTRAVNRFITSRCLANK